MVSSPGSRSNSDYLNKNINGEIAYDVGSFDIGTSISYEWREIGIPGPRPYRKSIPVFGDSFSSSLFDRERDDILLADIRARIRPNRNTAVELKTFGDRRHIKYHTKYLMQDTVIEDYSWLVHTLGFNLIGSYNLNRVKIAAGIDGRYDSLTAGIESNQQTDTSWQPSEKNIGGWLSANIHLSRLINVNPSLRYDHNYTYGNFLSPQLGLVVPVMQELMVKGSAGRAFRAPTFNDLYSPKYGNKEVKPESCEAYELAIDLSPHHDFLLSLTGYVQKIRNKISWQPVEGGLWKPININYTSIKGVECGLSFRWLRFSKTQLDLTYQEARQRNRELVYNDMFTDSLGFQIVERDAAYVPKCLIGWKNYFYLPYDITSITNFSYTGKRRNYYENWSLYPIISMDRKILHEYYIIDFALSRPFGHNLSLSVGLKNIFNRRYAIQFGNSTLDRDYPMPDRTIFLEMNTSINAKSKM